MTDNLLSKKYIDITLNNTTSSPVNIDFAKESSVNIVDDASQYDLSIIRFKIPSSSINKFIIPSNSEDYKIYMRKNGVRDGTNILSKSVIASATLNSGTSSDLSFREPKEFIDFINRSFVTCYYDYLIALNNPIMQGASLNFNYTNTNSLTQVFPFGAGFPSGVQAINMMRVSFKYTANSTQKILHGLKVYLIFNGKECLLLENPDNTTDGQMQTLVFSDGYHTSSDASYQSGLLDDRCPKEPLYKLYNSSGSITGTSFSIRIESTNTYPSNDLNMAFQCFLYVGCVSNDEYKSPQYTPYFSIDSSNNLTFNYSNNWALLAPHVGFSPKLRNMLDNFEYNSFDGIEYLNIPSQTLDASETINKSITQLQSSLYQFNQINKLEFTSIIPVEYESVGGSTTSSILTDFAIDTSALGSDYFIYNATSDYRKYRLLSNVPLKRLQFTGYVVYNDGTRKILQIRSGETANLKIQLSPI